MKILGRHNEIKKLHQLQKNKKSELLLTYGRRRVGKTFLMRSYFHEDMVFDITGLHKGTTKDQLVNFHKQLNIRTKKFDTLKTPENWQQAFTRLEQYINSLKSKKKKVIFIDEFPWIATPRSKFLMWFENFWNSYCTKRDDLIVIICGSAAAYMVNNLLHNKGGLHNRISEVLRLEPFTLKETKEFLISKNIHLEHYDILQLYMAIGGVPHYLEKVNKGESVTQNINRLCFEKNGALSNEFKEVFSSLFENSKQHIEIVKTLANSSKGLSRMELLKACNLEQNGATSSILNELIESGFVQNYRAYKKKERDAIYRLTDEYCNFYLKFIEPYKNQGTGTWEKLASKQVVKIWSGYTFESICLKHIQPIKNALGIANVFTTHTNWHNEQVQIDLLIDRDDNRINLCELKFYQTEFTIDKNYLEELRRKVHVFKTNSKTRKGVYLTMISTFGVTENAASLAIVENNLTIDCLF
jgi:AAA+ ATPase superfamily predicted ATPase